MTALKLTTATILLALTTACGTVAPGARLAARPVVAAAAAAIAPSVTVIRQATPEATQLDADLDDYATLGAPAPAYGLTALGLKALIKPETYQRLLNRFKQDRVAVEKHVVAHPELRGIEAQLASVPWTVNPDGTKHKQATLHLTRTQDGKSYVRTVQLSLTVDGATNAITEAHAVLDETFPDGTVGHATRDKLLQPDASYHVTLHGSATGPKGHQRVDDITRVVTPDGHVTGHGHTTWTAPDGQVTRQADWDIDRTVETDPTT